MEKLIKDQVTAQLDKHNLIRDLNMKGGSCTANLLMHLETVTKHVAVDVIYLDLQKASHKSLLQKLKAHGIEGQILGWIQAWLADRKQRVVVQGAKSETSDVSSSVVQGSVLGPLCFLIHE
ncbi:uncharacterized protein [Amphiura filiformis]|uniref:uncharacterized protein n=1 Tax=Amphiura filiformis TaxID=82378 RepID=UPI003B21DCAE